MYPCEATSVPGFVQQLAVAYLAHGYWFYVPGSVPPHKDPRALDRKLIDRYEIGASKWARARRKRAGEARLQYLRYGTFFLVLATHGRHPFFALEAGAIRDARRAPIRFGGYAVSHRGGHAHVRIDRAEYVLLRARLLGLAVRRPAAYLGGLLGRLPYEPYAPVRRQLLLLHREVNRARKRAGLDAVPVDCLRLRRRIYLPFGRAHPRGAERDEPPAQV